MSLPGDSQLETKPPTGSQEEEQAGRPNNPGREESQSVEGEMSGPARNLELARSYLESIESGATGGTIEAFFAPGVEFVIFPNLLLPQGDRHKLAGALAGAERGRKIMARQKYLIPHEMVEGDRVALEVEWTGTLALPFGGLPAGSSMKAYFAMFLEFQEGKIARQRNYDCFEKW